MTIPPMTSEEAAAFLKGVEWMRGEAGKAARRVPIPEQCNAWEAHGRLSASLSAAIDIRAIPAPTVPRLGFGVLGEG